MQPRSSPEYQTTDTPAPSPLSLLAFIIHTRRTENRRLPRPFNSCASVEPLHHSHVEACARARARACIVYAYIYTDENLLCRTRGVYILNLQNALASISIRDRVMLPMQLQLSYSLSFRPGGETSLSKEPKVRSLQLLLKLRELRDRYGGEYTAR